MRKIRALAPAKINLTFDILGVMPDGYHKVETLLQAIDLRDDIVFAVTKSDTPQVSIKCTNEVVPRSFPVDESNLMHKATRFFFEQAKLSDNFSVDIQIEKNIPIGAGLAGGSTNAAATLVALNALFENPLSIDKLLELGRKLGADVPFCIIGGTAVGTGRGDILRPVTCSQTLSYCVIKPKHLSVSTPAAYTWFDHFKGNLKRPNLTGAVAALESGDIDASLSSFGNVFQPVVFAQHTELAGVAEQLQKVGCWYTQLSGSGPAIFAVVANREQSHFVRRKILKTDDLEFDYVRLSMPDVGPPLECYIAQSQSTGVQLVDC